MKYLLFIFILGCSQSATVTEMDGCEYIVIQTNGNITSITHKGNCSNSIHQYQDTSELDYHVKPYLYGRFNNKDVRMVGR